MSLPRRKDYDDNVVEFQEKAIEIRRKRLPKLDPIEERARIRGNVAALIFSAILILGGWWLVQKLGRLEALQDCVMQGRTNCAPISRGLPGQ